MNGNTIAAIYTFAAHHHGGQWSRGYRLLCQSEKAWKRHAGIGPRLEYWEQCLEDETNPITKSYHRLRTNHPDV